MEMNVLLLIVAGIAIGVATLVLGSLMLLNRLRAEIQLSRRVQHVSARRGDLGIMQTPTASVIRRRRERGMDSMLGRVLPTLGDMRRRFRKAGLRVSLAAYVVVLLAITALLTVLFGDNVLLFVDDKFWYYTALPFAVATHLTLNNGVLNFLINRREKNLVEQMPVALDFLTRSVTVGQPIDTALRETAKEIDPPLKDEFESVLGQLAIGTPLDRALRGVSQEIEIREFDFFAIATIVQLESGGNLGHALRNLAETIRQRHAMRMKVQALASEGKASATVLAALPVLLLIYFSWANPDYVKPLFETDAGNFMLAFAFLWIGVGALVMRRIVRIKI